MLTLGCNSGNARNDKKKISPEELFGKEPSSSSSKSIPPKSTSGLPAICRRTAQPTAGNLGLKPKRFLGCLEKMFATTDLPAAAKTRFVERKGGAYEIKDYMSVVMKVTDGYIASMDVFFFNNLRQQHGMQPEFMAQYATLSVVFPSAGVDPRRGKSYFKEIDAIGRKTNSSQIAYKKDGIALAASFLPISVRYRFTPEQ
jgi:hypothetical protein